MPDLPLQFTWRVAKAGYGWVQSQPAFDPSSRPGTFLTDGRPIGAAGSRVGEYQPLDAFPGLFRVFADTEASQDGIKAFADRFGPLGPDVATEIPLPEEGDPKHTLLGIGEAAGTWLGEILTMRFVVDLWEAARSGDVGRLQRVISWTENGNGVQIIADREPLPGAPVPPERGWIAGTHFGDDVHGRFVRGDLVRPALHYVQSKVNQKLKGRASPCLLWDKNRERLGLYMVPDGLIGALWLQFARAVDRDSKFRQCAECGIWFELARGTARADKLYCSTPCRTKAYRKRQAEAARRHAEGQSIEEIARTLESDPDTVRGWIERKVASGDPPRGKVG